MQPYIALGERDLNTVNHWRNIDEKINLYTKPTLLFLPGAGVSAKEINGALKRFANHLPPQSNMRLLGALYCNINNDNHKYSVQQALNLLSPEYNKAPQAPQYQVPSSFTKEFFLQYFTGLVCDEQGKKLPLDTCCRRMRALTIITHCYGSIIAYELDKILNQYLHHLHYQPQEIEQIHKSLTIINFAARAPIGLMKSSVLHIFSLGDGYWLENWRKESLNGYIKELSDTFYQDIHAPQKPILTSLTPTESLFILPRISKLNLDQEHALSLYLKKPIHFLHTSTAEVVLSALQNFLHNKALNSDTSLQELLAQTPLTPKEDFLKHYTRHASYCKIGREVLPNAIRANNCRLVQKLLTTFNIPINLTDKNGHFPFYYVIQNKSEKMLDLFLEHAPLKNFIFLSEQDKPVIGQVLETQDQPFIFSFLKKLQQKASPHIWSEVRFSLQNHCWQALQAGKNCTAALPFLLQFDAEEKITMLSKAYMYAKTAQSKAARLNQRSILKLTAEIACDTSLYEMGDNSFISILKTLKAPAPEFMAIIHQARQRHLCSKKEEIFDSLEKHFSIETIRKLPVFDVFTPEQKQRETLFAQKTMAFLLSTRGKMKKKQVISRLKKRYARITEKMLQACIREQYT